MVLYGLILHSGDINWWFTFMINNSGLTWSPSVSLLILCAKLVWNEYGIDCGLDHGWVIYTQPDVADKPQKWGGFLWLGFGGLKAIRLCGVFLYFVRSKRIKLSKYLAINHQESKGIHVQYCFPSQDLRYTSWDTKAEIAYVSHAPEKRTYFYEDQRNFKENLHPLICLLHTTFDVRLGAG